MKAKLFFFTTLILAVRLSAADAEKTPKRPATANAPQREMTPPAGGVSYERVLTEEQRGKLRELMQAKGGNYRETFQKSAQARRDLQEAVFNGKADEAFIKEKTDEIAKLEAEQLRVRMTALSKIAETFTPEQRETIKAMGTRLRDARPGLGAGAREPETPRQREPAAPPPPEK
ncbi:MAG TPA: periplasmic heavy metal sensor [Candidatus Limnocylindria bacterium]|nr:periplasmic heavy metal sensor [Candidatus Limnocylindria bacterium]